MSVPAWATAERFGDKRLPPPQGLGGGVSGDPQLTPRKQPRQRRSQATVELILRAGASVLAGEGYAGATTNRIAEVAGVSVGSLYQYFPNKDALVLALADAHVAEMRALLAATAAAADGPVEEVVRTFVRAMIAAHVHEPALHRALVQQTLQLGFERFAADQVQIRAVVEAWIQSRQPTLGVADPKMAAFLLVATVEGTIHTAVFEDPSLLSDPAFEAELVRMVARYLSP